MNFHAMYRAAFLLVISLLTACGGSGGDKVQINSHAPSNSSVIYVDAGDAINFSVSGPTYSPYSEALLQVGVTGQWAVYKYEPDNYMAGGVLGVIPRSRVGDRIDFKLGNQSQPFSFRFDVPTADAPQYYVVAYTVYERLVGGSWDYTDSSRSWLIYAGASEQAPPVWEGDFIVTEPGDFDHLNGYDTINGSLSVMPFSSSQDEEVSIGTSNSINVSNNVDGRERNGAIQLGFINTANPIASLDALSNLESISGNLNIFDNAQLVSFSGLENLTSVAGEVLLYRNVALESIQALGGVTHIGDDLFIDYQPKLASLQGLEGLSQINGDLAIVELDDVDSLQALNGLTVVAGDLWIEENDGLQTLNGLDSVTSVGEKLIIKRNTSLVNLDGLNQLDSVGANFSITTNAQLCNSAAEALLQLVQSRGGVGSDSITVTGNDDC